jgi:hypothetical protein
MEIGMRMKQCACDYEVFGVHYPLSLISSHTSGS